MCSAEQDLDKWQWNARRTRNICRNRNIHGFNEVQNMSQNKKMWISSPKTEVQTVKQTNMSTRQPMSTPSHTFFWSKEVLEKVLDASWNVFKQQVIQLLGRGTRYELNLDIFGGKSVLHLNWCSPDFPLWVKSCMRLVSTTSTQLLCCEVYLCGFRIANWCHGIEGIWHVLRSFHSFTFEWKSWYLHIRDEIHPLFLFAEYVPLFFFLSFLRFAVPHLLQASVSECGTGLDLSQIWSRGVP